MIAYFLLSRFSAALAAICSATPRKAVLFREPHQFKSSGGINPPSGKKIPGLWPGILLGRAQGAAHFRSQEAPLSRLRL